MGQGGLQLHPGSRQPHIGRYRQLCEDTLRGCQDRQDCKECYGYDVELSNELDMKFNKNGQLINIDD